MRQEQYNGWTNYETWAVGLYLDLSPSEITAQIQQLRAAKDQAPSMEERVRIIVALENRRRLLITTMLEENHG